MGFKGKHLFISQAFPPQKNSTAQLLDYFLESNPEFFDSWAVLCPKSSESKYPVFKIGPQPSNGFSRVWFAFLVFLKLAWSRPNFLLSTTNPPFLLWVIAFWGQQKKIPFAFLILDLYPECLTQTNVLNPKGLISKVWKSMNRWAFKKADYIWVIGRDMQKKIHAEYGIPLDRIQYKPLWAPFNQPTYEHCQVSGPIKICYSGNIGLLSDLRPLINAAKVLNGHPVEFYFFGQGKRLEESENLARELGINVSIKPMVKRNLLIEHLKDYHIHYVGLRPGLWGVAVPCKVYGIMAAGRAVLAQVPKNSEIDLVINEFNVGVNCSSETELAEEIKKLIHSPKLLEVWGRNAHEYYKTKADLNLQGTPFGKNA